MSISVAIGSDYQDIKNIQDTITILNFVRNLVSNKSLHIANDSASVPDIDLDYDYVDNILDWYTGIYQILVDVSVFAEDNWDWASNSQLEDAKIILGKISSNTSPNA